MGNDRAQSQESEARQTSCGSRVCNKDGQGATRPRTRVVMRLGHLSIYGMPAPWTRPVFPKFQEHLLSLYFVPKHMVVFTVVTATSSNSLKVPTGEKPHLVFFLHPPWVTHSMTHGKQRSYVSRNSKRR